MTDLLVVGHAIYCGDEVNERFYRVDTMNDAIDDFASMIEFHRDFLETMKEVNVDGVFRFFIGTLQHEKTIPVFLGKDGDEIDGIDLIVDRHHFISEDYDFDEIVEELNSLKS